MLQIFSRILPRNRSVWEPTSRCLFGFGKKKETIKESSSPDVISEKDGNIDEKQLSDSHIHELNKERKEEDDLPIKIIPPDQDRRLGWLSRKAIIFYVPRRRSGYAPEYAIKWGFRSVKLGWFHLVKETKQWWKETMNIEVIKEIPVPQGIVEKVFEFRGADSLTGWVTTCDSDHNEGYSTVNFSCGKDGRAVFSGELSTRLPKDGRIKFAGYCNVHGPTKYRSFKEVDHYNWVSYNSMELRVRGDGRTYMVNLHTPGPFDTLMDDIFNYPLYTRGGPYWQTVRIPFSKFIFSNKAKIQDTQYTVPLYHAIRFISFTLADNADGPFKLEIDYVGVVYDASQEHEEQAYEEYKVNNLMIQN